MTIPHTEPQDYTDYWNKLAEGTPFAGLGKKLKDVPPPIQDTEPVSLTADSDTSGLRERLAAIEHERWADWQKWCHKVLREANPSPEIGDILERWDRQIETPYAELSEKEKDSDREQVDRYWPLVDQHVERQKQELLFDLDEIDNKPWRVFRKLSKTVPSHKEEYERYERFYEQGGGNEVIKLIEASERERLKGTT